MKIQRVLMAAVLTLAVFTMVGGVVSAHHSKAFYDGANKTTTKGTVVEWKWRNPHVFLVWDVKDANGKVVQWTGEFSSVTSSIGDGMTKDTFKPGMEVVVTGAPSKAGSPQNLISKVTKPDGTVIVDLGGNTGGD